MQSPDPVITRRESGASHHVEGDAFPRLNGLPELNFAHLLYFWCVARDGSIASACNRLNVSQPTVSMQIRKLEKSLGHRLFDRSGRTLVLTEIGKTVYEYANDMFMLGNEMLGTLRGLPGRRSGRLHVGIPTFLPKLLTYRLLQPVIHLPNQVRLVCHEGELNELIMGLSTHRFDVILTDTPVHSSSVRTFSHSLGNCGIAICAIPAIARRFQARFPESLDGAPMLFPTTATEMRRTLDTWFDSHSYRPNVIAEFDDCALMKEFAAGGAGMVAVPAAVLSEVEKQYGVELVGRLDTLRVRYFAVTTERKLTHPATQVIHQTAREGLLDDPGG